MGPEAKIEQEVTKWFRLKGGLVYKFVSPGNAGVPDRIFISPRGEVCFIEFKAPGEKPTPLQLAEINKLRKQGTNATWFDNAQQAKDYLTPI